MNANELARLALRLATSAGEKLDRWNTRLEESLGEEPPDLKDLGAFLTCVKRTLEIARVAGLAARSGEEDGVNGRIEIDLLRQLLSEED